MITKRTKAAVLAVAITVVALALWAAYQVLRQPVRFDPGPLERYYSKLPVPPAQPADADAVKSAIKAAAGYLRRNNLPSGQFVYLVNMNPAVKVPPSYNLLRHAGTIYSLGMAQAVVPEEATVEVVQRAALFMRECCLSALRDGAMVGLWEPPEIAHGANGPPTYKLGGAGLALTALAGMDNIRPGAVPPNEMQGLARFGQFMLRRDGEFFGDYIPSKNQKLPLNVLFYPGEMTLGWLKLYERQPDPELILSGAKALGYLAKERAKDHAAPADHWALLATADLIRLADRDKIDIPREALFHHALQICHEIIEQSHAPAMLPVMEGALVPRGWVTPTATRLEGLLAALTFLPNDHPMRPHVESAVHRGIDFLLRAQVKSGKFAGAMPRAIAALPEDGSEEIRKFNAESTEIRVDYVQHSLSAFVQYFRWIADVQTTRPLAQ